MSKNDILNNPAAAMTETADVFQPLARSAMFWRPNYLEPSAWMEHLPFAFWLIEAHQPKVFVELGTHHGTSYFSFCQAVDRLGLDTRCYAIDTWKGDEHAGLFDEKIFLKVKEHNETKYSGFSRLVRSTFDEALPHFSDGTIDLLHIDGLHTLEAVTHDFESWLPKLSKRAVVIMHDSNVRERNFGVFKLFENLREQYPSFEFVHGHGLGVLGVGASQTGSLQSLYAASKHDILNRSVQDIFARLGRACADTFEVAEQKKRTVKINDELGRKKKEIEETKSALEKTRADLTTRVKDLAETRAKLQSQVERNAAEKGQLEERSNMFQGLYTEIKAEFSKTKITADGQLAEQRQRDTEISRLNERNHGLETQVEELHRTLAAHEHRIRILVGEADKQQLLTEEKNELLAREKGHVIRLKEKDEQIALLLHEKKLEAEEIRSLQDELKNSESQLKDSEIERQKSIQVISNLNNAVSLTKEKVEQLQNERSDLINNIARLNDDVEERANEIASLTRMLSQSEELAKVQQVEIQSLLNAEGTLRQENERLVVTLQETQQQAAFFEAKLTSANETIVALNGASQREATNVELEAEARLKAEIAALKNQYDAKLDSQKAECERLQLESRTRHGEVKALQDSVAQRFIELAALTEMLEMATENLRNEKESNSKLANQLYLAEEQLNEQQQEMSELSRTHLYLKTELEEQLAKKNTDFQMLAQQVAGNTLSIAANGRATKSGIPLLSRLGQANTAKRDRKLMRRVHLLKTCELFNENWYLERYPDVKQSGIDPAEHYLCYGAAEMRDPGPLFSTQAYVSANADVAESGINPLIHYLHHGSKEGRSIESAKNV